MLRERNQCRLEWCGKVSQRGLGGDMSSWGHVRNDQKGEEAEGSLGEEQVG